MEKFSLTPKQYPKIPSPRPQTSRMQPSALDEGSPYEGNELYIRSMLDNDPEYADYSAAQKEEIYRWMKGGEIPSQMPNFLASAEAPAGQALPPKQPPVAPAAQPKKPVGPQDVLSNSKAPDYVAQRYAGKTPDEMNTAYLNDVFKRRMGYSAEPMDEQLAAFGKSRGMNEGVMNAALDRHYAGVQANNPYARMTKEQLGGRDEGTAIALKLLRAGHITSDQMPMIAKPTWSDDNAQRFGEAEYQGFSDSRQRQAMEGVDAAYGAVEGAKELYGRTSDYVRSMFTPKQGPMPLKDNPFRWEQAYKDQFTKGLRGLPKPVTAPNGPTPRQVTEGVFPQPNYAPTGVLNLPSYNNNPRISPNLPFDANGVDRDRNLPSIPNIPRAQSRPKFR
jgi:hypothetical protein